MNKKFMNKNIDNCHLILHMSYGIIYSTRLLDHVVRFIFSDGTALIGRKLRSMIGLAVVDHLSLIDSILCLTFECMDKTMKYKSKMKK